MADQCLKLDFVLNEQPSTAILPRLYWLWHIPQVFLDRSRIIHCLVGMVRRNRQPLSATLAHELSNCWNREILDPFLFELVSSTNYCSFYCINNDEK